jgi:hypothetical protein
LFFAQVSCDRASYFVSYRTSYVTSTEAVTNLLEHPFF